MSCIQELRDLATARGLDAEEVANSINTAAAALGTSPECIAQMLISAMNLYLLPVIRPYMLPPVITMETALKMSNLLTDRPTNPKLDIIIRHSKKAGKP